MSELLQDILDFYLPNGLPSEEEIKKMTDDERNQLFDAQSNVISTFRRMAIAKMNEMELRIIKAVNTLSKPPKLPTEEPKETEQVEKQAKIDNQQVKQAETKQNKSITKTPTKSPAKSSSKTPNSKTPNQKQQTPRTPRQSHNATPKTGKFTEKTTKFKEIEDHLNSIKTKVMQSPPANPYIH
ncbi:hypothetical protein TVAG_060560 [Trichomonas vaginalis G3]|uniref:Uncharacterized protein n=1 Tax=Trichomonas vaginalis (strain ATCC PRA-98 / G3) TaxID=412133 RepID=A2ECI5_TRIV3|nr:hypothetical protein TVAGG3_0311960 [Trichomonas vaginalis G3]EAY09680.1 hypothetical protein TVAG_060560 [Trichomonas vaginalis G3]KAI5528681.1 hypothetical protein TVAGG3_0311960 [Trichomonas vaginalis G3]|eukprot:XP_001321903.1 hypothetical protein [Trichomonas vaginalis G3]